jgi:hypothetical protein
MFISNGSYIARIVLLGKHPLVLPELMMNCLQFGVVNPKIVKVIDMREDTRRVFKKCGKKITPDVIKAFKKVARVTIKKRVSFIEITLTETRQYKPVCLFYLGSVGVTDPFPKVNYWWTYTTKDMEDTNVWVYVGY